MTVDYRYFVCLITGIVLLYFSHQEMNFSVSTFALCSTLMTVNDKYTFSSFNDLLITSIEFFFFTSQVDNEVGANVNVIIWCTLLVFLLCDCRKTI